MAGVALTALPLMAARPNVGFILSDDQGGDDYGFMGHEHDSNLEKHDDIADGLKVWVVIDGWDKLTAKPEGKELYNLKTDPDDRHNLAATYPEKVAKLSMLIEQWVKETPQLHK